MIAHASPVEHAGLVVVGVIAVAVYGWAWLRTPAASRARFGAWVGGVLTLVVSVAPFVELAAQRSFTGHMVQHLLIIVVAAPLLVLAAPIRTLRALPGLPSGSAVWERRVGRSWRRFGAPLSAAVFVGVLYVTHLTAIYDEALRHRVVHDIEHVAYLVSAVTLWSALRTTRPQAAAARIGAVFAVIAASALLGMVLLSASTALVPTYVERRGASGALDDQRWAASLMWIAGMATTLPLLLMTVWRWAAAEERTARRSEAIRDAAVDLGLRRID